MAGQMIDWDLAVKAATTMAGQGPDVSRAEVDEVVAELRAGAARSSPLVREFTGLTAQEGTAPVLVVDRHGWVQANADAFQTLIEPVIEKLQERRGAPNGLTEMVGSRITGLEVGTLLGFLAGKVLGQFDPFYGVDGQRALTTGSGAPSSDNLPVRADNVGRLLLVAPNIVQAEREIEADPSDFRLWVCLHEETHRVQFTAVPWMRDHLKGQVDQLVDGVDVDPAKVLSMLGEAAKRAGEIVSGRGETSLVELFATPEQRAVIDNVTGVMSLLEGHADVVMDGVGPEVIPSVARIRERFNRRRKGSGSLDKLVRRLLGLDAKMAQYRNGAHFVRTVVKQVGMDGFNKVWVEPENLPSKPEIGDPAAWVRRVHG
jgi:coenzyme F420 biosynthesis associated uncharacterized protein